MNKPVATNPSAWPHNLIICGVLLLLAPVIGFLLSTPDRPASFVLIGLVIGFLLLPLLLRWHQPALIFTWNAAIHAFFLPGSPAMWMVFGGISFVLTVVTCILNKKATFQHVPSISWSLLLLAVIVLVTAKINGGIGFRVLGGTHHGGKGYVYIVAGIMGFFALSATRIRPERRQLFATLFFGSGLTFAISNLAYMAGPAFYFLYAIFPVQFALSHYAADLTGDAMVRLAGIGFASIAACQLLLLRYGVQGLFAVRHPWRLALFVLATSTSFFGGFRSSMVLIGLLFAIQFCLEGLLRSRYVVAVLVAGVLAYAVLLPTSSRLPLSIQRALTVVPFLELDAQTRANARASLDWRLDMWGALLPEVRQHFFVGKGYRMNPMDFFLAEESVKRGFARDYEATIVAGDYHNGPLTLIIPFGIFGVAAFLWFLIAGGKMLYRNWKYGDPTLRNINTFIFSAFLTKLIFFWIFFGSFYMDLVIFLGLVGFSLAINGVAKPAPARVPAPAVRPDPSMDVELAYQR